MDSVKVVLVLYPNFLTKATIRSLPQDVSKKYRFIFHQKSSSLQNYFEDAKSIISKSNVKIILSTGDIGALMKAALVQEFSHLLGPSVESVFLANNKYYTRCFLDPQPIPFASLDLSATNLDEACEEALEKVGTPAFFKPVSCSGSVAVFCIQNVQHLKTLVLSYSNSGYFTLECWNANFMNSWNIEYPLASKPAAIIEKFIGDAVIINSDSYVLDGKIYHWSISDNLYSAVNPCYFFGEFFPTRLSESAQQKVWNVHDAVVTRMIEFGFDNEFVNVETFMLSSGEVKLMEVNPRKGGNLYVSGEVFKNGNILEAQLRLTQGEDPGLPAPTGRCALRGFVRTNGSGKAEDLYDFSYTDPRLVVDVLPDQFINGCGESGFKLCQALVSGDSYKDVMEKYFSLCRRVLLKPELSVWQ